MDIKKEDPSKVIIIPRPPRSLNHGLVPIEPADEAEEAVEEEETEAVDPIAAPEEPGFEPLNNQVQGPAQGLAGVPKK